MVLEKSFIVELFTKIFIGLEKIFCRRAPNNYGWTELYVITRCIISLLVLIISSYIDINNYVKIFFLLLSIWFIIDIFVYQINVLLFHRIHYNNPPMKNYVRTFILVIFNYFTIILFYANLYLLLQSHFSVQIGGNGLESISSVYFSTVTMATLGYGDIIPADWIGRIVNMSHTILGVFFNLVILGSIVSLLPSPGEVDSMKKETEKPEKEHNKSIEKRIEKLENDSKIRENLMVILAIISVLAACFSAYSAWSIDQKTPDLFESELCFLAENRTIETINESYFNVSFLINNSGVKAGQDVAVQFIINEPYSIVDYGYSFERERLYNEYRSKNNTENSIIFKFDSIARNNVTLYIVLKSNGGFIPSSLDEVFYSGVLWESDIIQGYLIEKEEI